MLISHAINQFTLNTVVVGSGTVTKTPDQPLYNFSTLVQLVATPAPGWHFVKWTGDLGGNFNPINVLMNNNKSVTANFAQDVYTLDLQVVGLGVVNKSPDQPTYLYGDVVTITPSALAGWQFTGWSGDASGSANPLLLTMNGSKSVTATFTQITFTLNVTIVGSGTVSKSPDQATYVTGDVVTLEATPAAGWSFVAWSGGVAGTDNPIDIFINGNKNVTATFTSMAPPAVTLISPNGGEALAVGSQAEIKWTATDASGPIATVDLYVSRDAGKTYDVVKAGAPNTGTFDWTITSPPQSSNKGTVEQALFKVVAKNAAGKQAEDVSDLAVPIRELAMPATFGLTRIDGVVKAFELGTVAPNPASGPLRVDFSVAKESPIRLEVLDIQGRVMKTLADGTYPAGRYQEVWDGSSSGGRVPAGMYFVRYQAAGLNFTKRVIITR